MTLSQLRPLLALRGCEFVSLQYGEVSREAADACSQLGVELRVPGAVALHDLDDMAALAAEMDVVVSVQNTLVHLCGAIGQRALAMIPSIAEWRYGSEGSAMAWYRSVSLYRQGPDQDWGPVVEAVVRDLKDRTAPAPS